MKDHAGLDTANSLKLLLIPGCECEGTLHPLMGLGRGASAAVYLGEVLVAGRGRRPDS